MGPVGRPRPCSDTQATASSLHGTPLHRFLRLLTTVARDQGKPFEAFVPDLVGLCTSQLGELVRVGDVRGPEPPRPPKPPP